MSSGLADGARDGTPDGPPDGTPEGAPGGPPDGARDGAPDREAAGAPEGMVVGAVAWVPCVGGAVVAGLTVAAGVVSMAVVEAVRETSSPGKSTPTTGRPQEA